MPRMSGASPHRISAGWPRKSAGTTTLAAELWRTGIHDARILATLIDDPAKVTLRQMEQWAADFNSWAVCDAACCCLFDKTPHAWDKAVEWTEREQEYVKRAGFVLMAALGGPRQEGAG